MYRMQVECTEVIQSMKLTIKNTTFFWNVAVYGLKEVP
jgi:hypothetical protein